MSKNLQNFKPFNLAKSTYLACLKLKLPYHLRDQLLRAASSSALNLAEGSGRKSILDKCKFYNIAFASIRECQSIIMLANMEKSEAATLLNKTAACTYRLLQSYGHF